MKNCREVEALLAPYADGEMAPEDRADVDSHLEACRGCRDDLGVQQSARELIGARRQELRQQTAPSNLHARCAAQAGNMPASVASGFSRTSDRSGFSRTLRRRLPLAAAATIVLAVAAVFGFGLNNKVQALALQMTLDHVKCARFSTSSAAVDPATAARQWTSKFGWALSVPPSSEAAGLELRGVRRCGVTDGRVAHLMYKWRGEPLSVYVLPSKAIEQAAEVERFGHDSVMWSQNGRTYVVLAGSSRRADLTGVVQYMRANVY